LQVDLAPKVVRTDAIQSFVKQETPLVRITCADGAVGVGYTYTIGTGGSSVMALLRDHLAPRLVGRDSREIEAIWKDLFFHTHATAVGAITSLALAAIDTALWDLKARRAGEPLWKTAGGAQRSVPVYTTEGGWLHHSVAQLVDEAQGARAQGFRGAKVKVGRPVIAEDVARLAKVRDRQPARTAHVDRERDVRSPLAVLVRRVDVGHPPELRADGVRPELTDGTDRMQHQPIADERGHAQL